MNGQPFWPKKRWPGNRFPHNRDSVLPEQPLSSDIPSRRLERSSGLAQVATGPLRGRRSATDAGAAVNTSSTEAAYISISRALLEGRLRPGTPMRERQLAEVFGMTRGAVRNLLLRLAHEGKLQLFPNRGAFVPQPSAADIRQVYDARKAVEAGLVALLASRITSQQVAALRAHVREERRAQRNGRRDESVKLAGGFHIRLVEALDNFELAAVVQRLVSRTQMYVALFEPARDSSCAPEEHEAILEALALRDDGRAAAAMLDHLGQVESRVLQNVGVEEPPQLVDILRTALLGPGPAERP
jgi:DNA-binding GntR family transcriptional regulator